MTRLVVDVSGHGFGHAGQLAPVLARLRSEHPDVAFVVRSPLSPAELAAVLGVPFATAPGPPDHGLLMHDPVTVDRAASRAYYAALARDFDRLVAEDAERLRALAPDLLISNIGFLGLAAADRAGIPAVALCSLDWLDVARAYDLLEPAMIARMEAAYRSARLLVRLTPHLPMDWHERARTVGPVARTGRRRRAELAAHLGCSPNTRIVLVAFGGIAMPRLLVEPPALAGVLWLGDRARGPGLASTEGVPFRFPDLLASVDLLITKTGYGLFAEAAAAGTPVLYLERPDWPEAPFLERWIRDHGIGAPLPKDPTALERAVRALLDRPRPRPVAPTGVDEAVALLATFL
ncbi:MAG: hypothetical protein N2038_05465 [Geminicoccaceae bacterium]|nr:hypothetical protein [Geminicoccaceae bacterium]